MCSEGIKEFKLVIDHLSTNFGNASFKDLMGVCIDHPKWIQWLDENNFISKELSYNGISCGDLFTIDGKKCILAADGCEASLVSMDGSTFFGDTLSIKNAKCIKDLDNIFYLFGVDDNDSPALEKILLTRVPAGSFEIVVK